MSYLPKTPQKGVSHDKQPESRNLPSTKPAKVPKSDKMTKSEQLSAAKVP